MSLAESPLQKLLIKNGVGFVGSIEGKLPSDLHIEEGKLKWTIASSSPKGGRLSFETPLNEAQIAALQGKLTQGQ